MYADGAGSEIAIALTQEEIASLAGTSRPTVNRVLAEEKDAGARDVRRGRVVVLDHAGLTRRAAR